MASTPHDNGAPFSSTSGDGGSPLAARPSLSELAAAIPELADLRRAASSPHIHRFTTAVTTLMSRARVVFVSALRAAQRRVRVRSCHLSASSDAHLAAMVVQGVFMHEAILRISALRFEHFSDWHWTPEIFRRLRTSLAQLVAPRSSPLRCEPPVVPAGLQLDTEAPFPHAPGLFLAALASGWSWSVARPSRLRSAPHGSLC